MNYKIEHGTHTGIKRDHNEDTYGVSSENNLWLVTDGMGGHDHGELASAMARDSILHQFKSGDSLKDSILKSNQLIIDSSYERGGDLPMGTTVVILNAKDACINQEKPLIKVVASQNQNRNTIIKVFDNGAGIPKEIMENIFIPFFTSKSTGSGIGLSLCKQIMLLHKGKILVNSVEDKGTVFSLIF